VNRTVDVALVGDAKAGLDALTRALAERDGPREPRPVARSYASDYRAFRDVLVQGYAAEDASPPHPGRLAVEVAGFFGEDAIVCLDGGNTGLWAHLAHTFRRPRSLMWTSHFGHLGTGLPYAIGAKLANPDRPVYLFTGDGAFGFNLQELETAARERVDIVVIVSADYAWAMEQVYMEKIAGTTVGVKHSEVRYDQVASALGCHGEYVERVEDLHPALERAATSPGPAVVHVAVDAAENVHPPGLDEFIGMYDAVST
jgi:acetolactate synthase-1/2/3 large subunit